MKSLTAYLEIADQMVQQDAEKNRMQSAMEDMWQSRWNLPEEIAGLRWVHKVVSTDPHDALRAGVRVLSSAAPRIKVLPVGLRAGSEMQADRVERALGWLFHLANQRRQASVLRDIVLSALLYDEVVAQVVYLPQQAQAVQAAGGDLSWLANAQRSGAFAILIRNPRQVHVRYSDWHAEAVLLRRVLPASEVVGFWGKHARGLQEQLQGRSAAELGFVTLYDYIDLEHRVVWAFLHQDQAAVRPGSGLDGSTHPIEILRQAHELGFLPWVARVGGTTLIQNPAHQRVPLLYSVYQSGQWETQNILETLLTSEVIAYAAAPRLKLEGISDNIEVDYGEPGRMAFVPPGHHLETMNAPGLDTSLAQIADRVGKRIDKSTVPRVLQTGDYPAGMAYATLNLATQSGLKSLAPYKDLAEQALAGIFTQMLNWLAFDGRPVLAYQTGRVGRGEKVVLDPADIDPGQFYLEVELSADVPSDRASRIEAAATAVRELGYSRARALEFIGESDPAVILEETRQERLAEASFEKQLGNAEGSTSKSQ